MSSFVYFLTWGCSSSHLISHYHVFYIQVLVKGSRFNAFVVAFTGVAKNVLDCCCSYTVVGPFSCCMASHSVGIINYTYTNYFPYRASHLYSYNPASLTPSNYAMSSGQRTSALRLPSCSLTSVALLQIFHLKILKCGGSNWKYCPCILISFKRFCSFCLWY